MRPSRSGTITCSTRGSAATASLNACDRVAVRGRLARRPRLALHQGVVDADQAVRREQPQLEHGVEVLGYPALSASTKTRSKRSPRRRAPRRVSCGRADPDVDLVPARRTRRSSRRANARDVGVDLARHHAAVGGQRLGHRERGVAGEHADLEHPPGPGRVHEHRQQLALDVAGEHLLLQRRAVRSCAASRALRCAGRARPARATRASCHRSRYGSSPAASSRPPARRARGVVRRHAGRRRPRRASRRGCSRA